MSSRMEGDPRTSERPRAWDAVPAELRDEALLDAYLAGELRGPELAEFEARLAADADLRAVADAQRRVDQSLRRAFVPAVTPVPARAPVPAEAGDGQSAVQTVRDPIPISGRPDSGVRAGSTAPTPRRWWGYAAAAALLLGGAAVFTRVYTHEEQRPPLEAHTVYASLNSAGWKPEFECKTDAEFIDLTTRRLGQPLVAAASPGVTLLGWGYADGYGPIVSEETMTLLTEVDGRRVLVLMDRKRNDRRMADPPLADGLRMFRRVLGHAVLYEITPLDSERVINSIRIP